MHISESVKKSNSESQMGLFTVLLSTGVMKIVAEIRRQNLELLIQEVRTADALAVKCGVSAAYLSQIRNQLPETKTGKAKAMGADVARRLESGMGKPEGWMDQDRSDTANTSIGPVIQGKVPLISMVAASDFATAVDNFHPGHAEEWVETTVPIHQHTYALRVDGPSMTNPSGQEPTFPHGCRIVVEPNLIDRPERMVNLFVIVRREGEDTATFKQLIRDGSSFLLHPLNPQFDNIPLREGDVFCGVIREKPVRYI